MRKNILWFVLAVVSFVVSTIGLPNLILIAKAVVDVGQFSLAFVNLFTPVALVAIIGLIVSTVKSSRRGRWVLVGAALAWAGLLFGTINGNVDPNQYLLADAVRISAAIWLGYGAYFATQLLLTMQQTKPNNEHN